ncbi:MAG: glycine cleavage T C-terminal barrel domain-containing protein [Candidatus Hydrogenedentales bacterium]|jgi:folate-binding protein YgfZ
MTDDVALEVRDDVYAVRREVGAWIRDDHAFIRLEGRDVATWLQTQTSNDVTALESGQGHASALLDRKGRLQAHFTLHRWEDEYWLVVERIQAATLMEQLEAHLFAEDVRLFDSGNEVEQLLIQGPRTLSFLSFVMGERAATELLPRTGHSVHPVEILGYQVLAIRHSATGEDGYLLIAQTGEAAPLLRALLEADQIHGLRAIGPDAQEILRVEAGIPRFGLDMDTTNRLPETTLERTCVSYTKGCYLGQEVIAKLRAYSSVKFALMGLELDDGTSAPRRGDTLYADGREVGTVRSGVYSPTLGRHIAMVYLDREHRAIDSTHAFSTAPNGPVFQARVVLLPFYTALTREEQAQALYDLALQYFQNDAHDKDVKAIDILCEAVLLHPTFEDAYEALGVILNRHHRVDEAIHYMQILAALNPACIMAHSNLSVFYVAKGMIAEAEEEKAKAAVLQLRRTSEARRAEDIAAEERERIRREALERIAMFKEVLEIDPDDPMATFGAGMAHMQLSEFDQATPYLERATQVQKDYSVAFLNLGKCHEFLGNRESAIAVFRKGIEAAGRKGDLMPLREMERRLKSLETPSA